MPVVLASGPIACEGLDYKIIGGLRERRLKLEDIGLLPEGKAWLMIEFGADSKEAAVAQARAPDGRGGGQEPKPSAWLIEDKPTIERMWTIRETGASATALALGATEADRGPDPVVGWEDAAVDPLRLGDYLREFQALVDRLRLQDLALRALWRRLHPRAHHLRFAQPGGIAQWRGFLARGRGPRREIRRLAVGRARRRPGQGRIPAR